MSSSISIRFTARAGTLYAITLAVPKYEVRVTSLGAAAGHADAAVRSVQLVGSGAKLQWRQEDDALVIETPVDLPCDHAAAFRIALE
jgi:alpha-L-fucosidase